MEDLVCSRLWGPGGEGHLLRGSLVAAQAFGSWSKRALFCNLAIESKKEAASGQPEKEGGGGWVWLQISPETGAPVLAPP